MTQPSISVSRIVNTTQCICSLPAIPTQSWATDVAQSLTHLAPDLAVGVIVAQIDPTSNTITPISTGAHQTGTHQSGSHQTSAASPISQNANQTTDQTRNQSSLSLSLLDKLERVRSLGFSLQHDALTRGLVAPLSALHPSWSTTPIGRIFAAQHLQCPTIAVLPITREKPGFILIVLLASPADQHAFASDSDPALTHTIAHLVPLLSFKSKIALEHVSNPKAWLTEREQEILDELILGNSVRVIAESLGRSAHTVHDHVKNLHKKLGASSRGELIAKALGHTSAPIDQATPASDPIVITGQSATATSMTELKPNVPHRQARALHHPTRDPQS